MKWITLVAALGACIALTSCDDPDQAQQTAQKSAAPQATCHCQAGQSQSSSAAGKSSTTTVASRGKHHSTHSHKHGPEGTYSMDLNGSDSAAPSHRAHNRRVADAHAARAAHAENRSEMRMNNAVLVRNDHGVRIWHGEPGMNADTAEYGRVERHRHDWRRHEESSRVVRYARDDRYGHDWRGDRAPAWTHRYTRTNFTEGVLVPYNYVSHSQVTYVDRDAGYSRNYPTRDTIPATMSGERLDPWHGYDVDCPRR